MGCHPWQVGYPGTSHVYVQIQASTQNWTFRMYEKIIWMYCEDQKLCYQVLNQGT